VLASKVDNRSERRHAFTKEETERMPAFTTGIAHTRWATHGGVTAENTHPHVGSDERFYVVHNGIIENYRELKAELEKKYNFYSDTDSEVIAKLIEDIYSDNLRETIERVSKKLV